MPAATILVVEDEKTLAEALKFNLERQDYRVLLAHDGHIALSMFQDQATDLVILDVMLPGLDGFEILRRIRARSNVPILMLTARDEEIDRVMGLEIGADDYLTKPFSLRELEARIKALLRRGSMSNASPNGVTEEHGKLRISPQSRQVWISGHEVMLRPREFELLLFFIRNAGLALSRRQLLDGAWESDFAGDERTVDVHVRALRAAIEDNPADPQFIVTVRGTGYRFESPTS